MRRVHTIAVAAAAAAMVLAVAPLANAHGDLEGTDPAAGSTIKKTPAVVTVMLSEPPTKDAVVKVRDGCNKNVVSSVTVFQNRAGAIIQGAHPGRFKVTYRVISATDGHETDGKFSFTVRGKADCGGGNNGTPEPDATQAAPAPEGDDGSDFPVLPVALGVVGLVGVAMIVRANMAS